MEQAAPYFSPLVLLKRKPFGPLLSPSLGWAHKVRELHIEAQPAVTHILSALSWMLGVLWTIHFLSSLTMSFWLPSWQHLFWILLQNEWIPTTFSSYKTLCLLSLKMWLAVGGTREHFPYLRLMFQHSSSLSPRSAWRYTWLPPVTADPRGSGIPCMVHLHSMLDNSSQAAFLTKTDSKVFSQGKSTIHAHKGT